MTVEVKICGLDRAESVDAAVNAGAKFLGFVFYPPSPRNLTPDQASGLTIRVPANVKSVGLFVNPTDRMISDTLNVNELDLIQLHGEETPERLIEIKKITNLELIKVIKISNIRDLNSIYEYESMSDWIMFDASAPEDLEGALPGGNALSFDWEILKDAQINRPWMLAGGLNAKNVINAIKISGARVVDVSSGVEKKPGVKSTQMIESFINIVQGK